MSATAALLVLVLIWLLIGVIASVVMGRRGHAPFTWGALGAVLGPLVIPLARQNLRGDRDAVPVVLSPGAPAAGVVDAVIGIDGSPESRAAVDAVIDLLGERLGQVSLVAAIHYDTAREDWHPEERTHAESALRAAAEQFRARTGIAPAEVLAPGKPADALRARADEVGCALIAVGRRGRGASKALLGSVATALSHDAPVPVLIIGSS
jgi:nucleotide-binding universal stress UspA family protein